MQFQILGSTQINPHTFREFNFENILLKAAGLFLVSWFTVYFDLPLVSRLAIIACILVMQLSSFYNSSVLILLIVFIPFYRNFDGLDISGLKLHRLAFLPYAYYSLIAPKRRRLKINGMTLFFIIGSFISIILTAEIRKLIQEMPMSMSSEESAGLRSTFTRLLDTTIILSFLYYSYTRLSFKQLSNLLKMLLLFAFLEAAAILFLVFRDIQSVIGNEFDKFYLWRNPFFGHKNDWGMMLVFVVHLAYLRSLGIKNNKLFYRLGIALGLLAIAFSLSRQAYTSVLVGFIMIFLAQQKFKPFAYLSTLLIILFLVQPAFLFDRIDSLINIDSLNDLQDLSRKVSDLGIEQAKRNFTLAPRMFFTDWEYNWSEGFWNGLLHQQGILGLLFHIILYVYLISRYYYFVNFNYYPLQTMALFGLVSSIIIFISNFNRRSTHLMHYDGNIDQIGFLSLFIILYTNLVYYSLKNNVKQIDDLR